MYYTLMCVRVTTFELLRTRVTRVTTYYWLPTYLEIYEMQCLLVTYRFGDTIRSTPRLFNCVSSGFPMPLLMPHGMWWIHACCSVVLSLLVSSVVGVMRHYCHEDPYCRERAAFVDAVAVGRESAMLPGQTLRDVVARVDVAWCCCSGRRCLVL